MLSKHRDLLLLHLIVFIWGWSPIMGKVLSLEGVFAFQLVWYRMLITVAVIILYFLFTKRSFVLPKKDILILFGIGAIIAFHWICFYYAINVSNVSVTLAAFATGTLFTSIVEPIFFKRKIIRYEIMFGLVIIGAIAMIFKIETRYSLGIIFGILAALTSSFFSVFNGLLIKRISSPLIAIYELGGGFIALTIFMLFAGKFSVETFIITPVAAFWLVLFAVVGTAFPFIASVNLMKRISPYTITLTVNLETIYGIIIAYFLWQKDEMMTPTFYLATFIILAVIFANGFLKNYLKRKNKNHLQIS